MPMNYDKLFALMKENGLTSYRIRQERIMGQKTLQHLREGKSVQTDVLCRLCGLLDCQPGDLMEYVKDKSGE